MSIPCCQQQRRHLTHRSTGRNVRPGLSAIRLSVVLFTAYFLSTYINWLHYKSAQISYLENNDDNHGTFQLPGTSITPQSSRKLVGTKNEDGNAEIHREDKRNIPYSSGLLKMIEGKSKLPETKDNLMRLSLSSNVDIEDLGVYLGNKSATVYNPGSWDGAGIVVEEFKLVFFTQGKVGCTVFKQLFRRMMKYSDWKADSRHLPHNPGKNGLIYLYHYNVLDALTILTHPDWTRAIFVRDPKERTLSAFLDKAARKKGKYVRRHCCNNKNSTCGEEASASFLGFLRIIGERCCCDPHWKRQSRRIDQAFMPFVNFVGHFDRIQADTERLLKSLNSKTLTENGNVMDDTRIDPWIEYGTTGWGSHGNQSVFSKDTQAKHRTSAITKLREYYNKTTEEWVEKFFAADYDDPILNFTQFALFDDKKGRSSNK